MNKVGLKRGTVELKKFHTQWKEEFENEKKLLMKNFEKVIIKISHGGSTSIPGLPAKPIIDMFAAVESLEDAVNIKDELEELCYEYHGQEGVEDRILT